MENHKKPIVVAGFGRSGTTWLSDIISKALGGLLLFEPFHPKVFADSKAITYSTALYPDQEILSYWNQIKEGKHRSKWLLRNHLRSPYESAPQDYLDLIWEKSEVIGFKTIRANHLLSILNQALGRIRPIYIIRHPLACLASIIRRPRFWEEFGWEWHWENFIKQTSETIEIHENLMKKFQTQYEKIIFMWAISQQIALDQVKELKGYITSYEALYLNPFEETKRILTHLGHQDLSIHPSYLFEPSMTSMRTLHNTGEDFHMVHERFPDFFWQNDLKADECEHLMGLIEDLPVNQPEIFRYLKA